MAESERDIAEVARIAGVSSRTLRHYDAIGLLRPARTSDDGRRFYGPAELSRLQHILVLRELGTPLETIAAVVDTEDPALRASLLRDHLTALEAERDRHATLVTTVRATVDALERGMPLAPEDLFSGFEHERYEPEARERWGDDAVERSNAAWSALGPEGQRRHQAEHGRVAHGLAALAAEGAAPGDPRVQELVAAHHAWVSLFWVPDAEAYTALGAMYADDHRFRATYDKFGDGTADLLRDAIAIYAAHALT